MTKIVVQPNASGTGTFTIAAPNSNNTRTLTLPDAAGTVFLSDGSGTIQPTNITDGTTTVGTNYVVNGSAKAWGRYSSGTTIYDSFNVSSATNYGTGDEGITFTTAFDNVQNYTSAGLAQTVSSTAYVTSMMDNANYRTKTASHFTYRTAWASTIAASTTFYDDAYASTVHHGDLA